MSGQTTELAGEAQVDAINFHIGLAEQGKIYHIQKQDTLALGYFREALKRAVDDKAPEVFFRYYMLLSLEILEKQGNLEEILEYCEKAITHYESFENLEAVAQKDLAETWQKKAVCHLKQGDRDAAKDAFDKASELAKALNLTLQITQKLTPWVTRHYSIQPQQLEKLLTDYQYYSIRKDTLQPEKAIKLAMLEKAMQGVA